jgi:hypothetical protein
MGNMEVLYNTPRNFFPPFFFFHSSFFKSEISNHSSSFINQKSLIIFVLNLYYLPPNSRITPQNHLFKFLDFEQLRFK